MPEGITFEGMQFCDISDNSWNECGPVDRPMDESDLSSYEQMQMM